MTPRNLKVLMALPRNEARLHYSFFFFFGPFFFFAMAVFLDVGVKSAGLVQVAGLIALDLSLALAPLPPETMTQGEFRAQWKNAKNAYFSVT